MARGTFIIIEGGEGAGKTSQIVALKKVLSEQGINSNGTAETYVFTREPGGSLYAEEIRHLILKSEHASQADAKTLFALFWAARADHLKNTIIPALEAGKTVICDRFDSSTFAYQIYGGRAHELESFFWEARQFFLGDYTPNAYIFLDVSPEVGLSRRRGEVGADINHFDTQTLDFHHRMRKGFTTFFETLHNEEKKDGAVVQTKVAIIDASQSFDDVGKALHASITSATMNS